MWSNASQTSASGLSDQISVCLQFHLHLCLALVRMDVSYAECAVKVVQTQYACSDGHGQAQKSGAKKLKVSLVCFSRQ